jgi:glycine/D-amino acid oxidase-like deaminating enzyme
MVSYWLDRSPSVEYPRCSGDERADVAIIGAGYTGLWAAIELLEREPACRVVVCEAERVGSGASGRNGGFLDPSLTHGLLNGIRHFAAELEALDRLAGQNYDRMRSAFARYRIDCDFEPVGTMEVATRRHEVDGLGEWAEVETRYGHHIELLDREEAQTRLHSPRLLAALRRPAAGGILDPAKLARGLAAAASQLGAVIHEHSPVTAVSTVPGGTELRTPTGSVRAGRVILATNAYSGRLVRRTRRWHVPIYDYVLVSEPLTAEQRNAVGWAGREGVSDSGNRFHYFRLTADDRILWGGYDAIYYPGGRVGPSYDHRPATYDTLQRNFTAMFPQLADLRFSHRWGGPIATTTRFTPAFGRLRGGRMLYALGYTGLGVATTCFAARVLADMVTDPASELLQLDYVRRSPFPFPPEPLRTAAVTVTRRAIARSDDRDGRRGPWLSVLDRFGVGFDS